MPENATLLSAALLLIREWYAVSRRSLPWREDPTPYHTWIAEIMLQQTRIEAVIPYYTRFLRELPDIASLAAVSDDRLLKLWEGLGYYSRARNLKKAALQIMQHHGGELPANAEELKKLPGIGDYTAGSIASIAFGLPEPAVDGNVLRVMTRFLACSDDISLPAVKKHITALLREEYPSGEAAALLTEGIMELGETVCLPNAFPHCDSCPLRKLCSAHLGGEELAYPVKTAVKERKIKKLTVFLFRCGPHFAICRRPETGLLAGLWEFPNTEGKLAQQEALRYAESLGLTVKNIRSCGETKHVFTHVEWHMTGWMLDCREELPIFVWKTEKEILQDHSLPTAFRYYQKKLDAI